MKLTDADFKALRDCGDDEEAFHIVYDDLLKKRLNELDPEYLQVLDKVRGTMTFWYA